MHSTDPVARRLGVDNRFVHAAVRAVAAGLSPSAPPAGLGWQQRASEHGVLCLLAAHLPDDPRLRTIRRARALHHLRTMSDMRLLAQVLDDADIEWLVFKGPVLSEHVYIRPGVREYDDLDILVRECDVPRAVARLEQAGARAVDGGWQEMARIGDGESAYRTRNGTTVDLHWDVINDVRIRSGFSVGTESLFARSREVEVDGQIVRTFGLVDTVLHVALHCCFSGGDKLRWLLDLQQSLLRAEHLLAEIDERATETGLGLVLRCVLNRMEMFVDPTPFSGRLPAPSLSMRTWLAADRAFMMHFPPGSRYEGRSAGAIMSGSTRARVGNTWRTLAAAVPGRVHGRLDRLREVSHRPTATGG